MSGNNDAAGNPGNFANRPTEEVKAIASKGGKAAAGHPDDDATSHPPGRNPDGTFVKGSEAAKEAGHIGGLHAQGKDENCDKVDEKVDAGRNPGGTFVKGSEAAKEAGHKGGLAAAENN